MVFVGDEECFVLLVECFEMLVLVDNVIIDIGFVWYDFWGVVV